MAFAVRQVQECLAGFDFPGTSDQLADHARDRGAETKLVDTLRSMKKDSFEDLDAVMSSLTAQNVLGG